MISETDLSLMSLACIPVKSVCKSSSTVFPKCFAITTRLSKSGFLLPASYPLIVVLLKNTLLPSSSNVSPFTSRRCITLHPGIGSGYSSFYGQLQSSLFFHEKRDINAPGSISLPFFIIQLSGSRSFPLTSCAFSDLFLSRCSIASCFHTFPHLRLSEATQNPCPLCRLSSYRGTR